MREILFKAKRIDNGEWVEGNIILSKDADEEYKAIIIPSVNSNMFTDDRGNEDLGFKNWYNVDPSTICQYTGLTDKNSQKIWENDVVYMRCNGLSGYGEVIYENGCYWIDDKKRGRKYPFSNHDVKYRVDRNIFDNTELLNE